MDKTKLEIVIDGDFTLLKFRKECYCLNIELNWWIAYAIYPTLEVPVYSERLRTFTLESLKSRYSKLGLITIFKIKNQLLKVDGLDLTCSSHRPNRILLPLARTALYRISFIFRNLVLWNKLIPEKVCTTLKDFIVFVQTLSFNRGPHFTLNLAFTVMHLSDSSRLHLSVFTIIILMNWVDFRNLNKDVCI